MPPNFSGLSPRALVPAADDAVGGAAPEPMAAYRALRQAGALEPDPAQQLAVERLQSLYRGAVALSARNRVARLARPLRPGRKRRRSRAGRALPVRPGRPRQIDADGSVLPLGAEPAQAPGPFPRLHARSARPHRAGAAGENRCADRQGRQRHRRPRRRCCASTNSRSRTSPTR